MIFSENQIYLKSSKFSAKVINKFLKKFYYNLEELEVLDFGCGPCTIHKFLNFKKVFLYDKEFFAIPNKNRKYVRFNNYNSILKNKQKYDLIIINSVIQYIAPNFLSNLINSLNKKLKKNGVIFLGDVPRIYRFLEFIDFKQNPYEQNLRLGTLCRFDNLSKGRLVEPADCITFGLVKNEKQSKKNRI